ncbi:MAG: antibiotic biosynthesis monooxygenase [Gammaproteobacteria bacterium]|nr:antibiotic biosynthesis monooxygenase [Gammaproteobacteria bacterium]MCY4165607.1 antibiotic biosynthesis monooxygenase [Gammaproteobacteria bacterium]MCY4255792.1 antibiotic biosynthesis monooxygenase [Gammaproteobacteria bacterium]MCY4340046.1 antibiotic biosynthesis monooxygenase [Gammaproteobacteria bacterium]
MVIAMNRFRIAHGSEQAFEDGWRQRQSYLSEVPGFESFALLKGPEKDDHVLYASHTVWESRPAFEAWTRSPQFRKAHAQRSVSKDVYLGHPVLELFEGVA